MKGNITITGAVVDASAQRVHKKIKTKKEQVAFVLSLKKKQGNRTCRVLSSSRGNKRSQRYG